MELSDARVLSIKEIFLLTGLGDDFDLPSETSEILIRQIIGECVLPLLIKTLSENYMKGVSLFSSAGIAELYFEKININIQIANELE